MRQQEKISIKNGKIRVKMTRHARLSLSARLANAGIKIFVINEVTCLSYGGILIVRGSIEGLEKRINTHFNISI